MRFKPTHQVIFKNGVRVNVMLVEGCAYSWPEWKAEDTADIQVVDGEWLFQGQPFDCRVKKIA